jgi:hypothetical protein
MVPGLEDRLMEGSNEDIVHIAELVCVAVLIFHDPTMHDDCFRYRRARLVLERTIQKA